jgi:hypothetical protein
MTANVKIIVRAVDGVLTVPNAALSTKLASTLGFSSAARSQMANRSGAAATGMTDDARDSLRSRRGAAGSRRHGPTARPGFPGGQHRGFRTGAMAAGDSSRPGVHPDTAAGAAAVSPAVTKTVYILQNGKPVQREVEIGMADGSNTEIVRGLAEGDLVITGLGTGKSSNGANTQRNRIPMMGGFGGPPPGGR